MTFNSSMRYWLVIQVPILIIAAFMSQVAAHLWFLTLPRPMFNTLDMLLPSCLTWLILAPFVAGGSWWRALLVGLASPIIGSVFVILFGFGPISETSSAGLAGFLALMLYGAAYILNTAWVTLPTAMGTGLLVGAVFKRWPPPNNFDLLGRIPWPQSMLGRLLLVSLPFLPFLAMTIDLRPDLNGPAVRLPPSWMHKNVLAPVRMLAELYFFPIAIPGKLLGANWLTQYYSILKIIYTTGIAVILWNASKRKAA